jgi:glycosyltransferase involved in cell wall biosynthesis
MQIFLKKNLLKAILVILFILPIIWGMEKSIMTLNCSVCEDNPCIQKKGIDDDTCRLWNEMLDYSPPKEKLIEVIIPSYNNRFIYKKNLSSVLTQKYTNYHITYIDDCSTDGTGDLVSKFIKNNNLEKKITLIKNEKNIGALANIHKAVHMCHDESIVVLLDGDDWFAKKDTILSLINKMYSAKDIWLTCGNFTLFPKSLVCSQDSSIPHYIKNCEQTMGIIAPVRTWYAWLFKKIGFEYFLYEGEFFSTCSDFAYIVPMRELAEERNLFIPDILYTYNVSGQQHDFYLPHDKIENVGRYIFQRKKHDPLF